MTTATAVLSKAKNLLAGVAAHRWFRASLVFLICIAGGYYYFGVVDKIYPAENWLFFTLAKLWFWMAVLSLSSVCVGHLILERVLRLELPPLEALVQSMSIGLMTFVMCMYAGGALFLYGPVFAVLLPALLIGVGARSFIRLARRLADELRAPQPKNPFVWVISALGACAVGLAYLGVMTPDALNYDSTWSHLVIAQDYARYGGIVKFLGNYNMGVPHLASIIHTWGFTVPGLDRPALRWMMALHNEFSIFCWTLAAITAGVRRMLSEPRLRGSWSGFFLFPMFFVYDSNMGGAADHIAAFFVVPLFLATSELWDTFQPKAAALVAVAAAGALLTKYQAFYLFVPLALLLAVRFAMLAFRLWRGKLREKDPKVGWRELVRSPLVLAGLGALLVAPHFVKNAIFYHNPFYPFAQDIFTGSTPSAPNTAPLLRYYFTDDTWRPKGEPLEKIIYALRLFATFSFEPHYSFSKNMPAFGSLFTLLLPTLVFLRQSLRIWLGAILAGGALLVWAYIYNLDRNLQIFLPLFACVTVALMIRVWQLGWIARAGLVPLVLFQLVWGGDAYFYSASDRIAGAFSMIRSGYDGSAASRFDGYRSTFIAVGKALPKNARVLLHTSHVTLGLDREVIMDWDAFQGFINYEALSTPREVYDLLKERKITHILVEPHQRSDPTKQTEVLFQDFLSFDADLMGYYGHFKLYRFPKKPPPKRKPYRVVTVGLSGYADGLYPIKKLNAQQYLPAYVVTYASPDAKLPADPEALAQMLESVDAVILATGRTLPGRADSILRERFTEVVRYEGYFAVHVLGKEHRTPL